MQRKHFTKSNTFLIENTQQTTNRKVFPKPNKGIYEKLSTNKILDDERLDTFFQDQKKIRMPMIVMPIQHWIRDSIQSNSISK